jgi:hypothetical protein
MTPPPTHTAPTWWRSVLLLVAVAGALVVGWVLVTQWGGVVHGHPAYGVLLGLTGAGCLLLAWRVRRPLPRRTGWRRVAGLALLVLGAGWLALVAWLRPHTAIEPALTAMRSDAAVTVTESPTDIVMAPSDTAAATGVFFQPGALVDARAYAAVLRPLAEAGHPVVVAKQPLGVAFLAVGAFDTARTDHPEVRRWVVAGHSLGGTVAAMEADGADSDPASPAVGLLLYASYPAGDLSSSLTTAVESLSGTRDGLSTPADIEASRADLPADTTFTVVEGASHAQFGDYGPQAGDGTPTISDDDARREISAASLRFVEGLSG